MANASIFLKLGDKIKGSSEIDGHKEWIEVLSWSWGASNHTAMGSGSRTQRGSTDIQEISFAKNMDGASNGIAQHVMNGALVGDAELHITKKSDKGAPETYYKLELSDCFIRSYQVGGQGGDFDSNTEQVSLGFSKVKGEFIPQDAKGAKGGAKTFTYDLKLGKEA